ncbi:MAG: LacI family transcriptional regulator [Alphaproteobacteria bacterium]|nr:LacI family transcriptional regulator [Alphaproteobacteria bacterium]
MTHAAQDRIARLADVATEAGVSQGTVSNVFNRPDIVRPDLRERVHAAAQRLGYTGPDPKGRLLRAGKVNAIGVATTQPLSYFFDDPFARAIMSEISRACDDNGCGISLISSRNEEVLSWNIGSALVDGLILFCLTGTETLIARANERGLPSIALAFGNTGQDVPAIDVDNVEGGRKAATHLADLGHRRFAILALEFVDGGVGRRTRAEIAAATRFTARDRVFGSFDVLSARGIDVSTIPVFETSEKVGSVASALETLFAEADPPTAIIAQSDLIAMIALEWFANRGISVPEDVSIIGFDGVPEAAETTPPLTTIAQPIAEIGRQAVASILDPTERATRRLLDTTLVVRASTAPPKG